MKLFIVFIVQEKLILNILAYLMDLAGKEELTGANLVIQNAMIAI